jgi:glycolate dehydrogenase FAD-binding subunit
VAPAAAILGVEARAVHAPTTLDEAVALMGRAARDRLRLAFVGGGTELGLGHPPQPPLDALIRTTGLSRVVEYAPSDMVMVVEAGITLAQVQATAREHRQMLALDPPSPERATVGGLVATGAFGPRRARYGAIRDLIIGVTLVRADGTLARSGGKVVKNVAGFDLPKVACGSLGTLGLIAVATFRLHPLPQASVTVAFDGLAAADVVALVARLRKTQLEPTSVVALRSAGGSHFDVGLRFEGFERGVEEQVVRSEGTRLSDPDAARFWQRHDDLRSAGPLRLKVSSLPTRLPDVGQLLGGSPALAWYATLGLGFLVPSPDTASAAALTAAREALVATGGSLIVEAAPADLRAAVDPWGPTPPGSLAVMERLKQRFDPDHRMNPGRFVGGL